MLHAKLGNEKADKASIDRWTKRRSLPLLDDDLPVHPRVRCADVEVCPQFGEGDGFHWRPDICRRHPRPPRPQRPPHRSCRRKPPAQTLQIDPQSAGARKAMLWSLSVKASQISAVGWVARGRCGARGTRSIDRGREEQSIAGRRRLLPLLPRPSAMAGQGACIEPDGRP
jgi:hypothetical protein